MKKSGKFVKIFPPQPKTHKALAYARDQIAAEMKFARRLLLGDGGENVDKQDKKSSEKLVGA